MRRISAFFCLAWLAGLAAGCAVTQPEGVGPVEERLAGPVEEVWASCVAALSGQYALKLVDQPGGVVETELCAVADIKRVARPPSNMMLPCWANQKVRLAILVRPVEGQATVRVAAHFEALEYNVTHAVFEWASNGVLEGELLAAIRAGLK